MDTLAVNYDPYATVPDTCYMALSGCFHPDALNTYCTDPFEYTKCVWSEKLPTFHTVATNNLGVCKFFNAPSPPPQQPGTGNVINTVEVKTVLEGEVSDYPASVTDPLAQKVLAAGKQTLPASSITTTVASASVQVTFAFTFDDVSSQSSFNSEVNSAMGNAADASSVLGIPVASVSIASVNVVIDDDDNVAVIVGAVVGGFFGLLLLAGVAIMIKRKQSKVEA